MPRTKSRDKAGHIRVKKQREGKICYILLLVDICIHAVMLAPDPWQEAETGLPPWSICATGKSTKLGPPEYHCTIWVRSKRSAMRKQEYFEFQKYKTGATPQSNGESAFVQRRDGSKWHGWTTDKAKLKQEDYSTVSLILNSLFFSKTVSSLSAALVS